jgi:iron complex transport system ATP-binding protein
MMGRYPYFDAQPGKEDLEAMNNMMYETDIFHLKDREYNTFQEEKTTGYIFQE